MSITQNIKKKNKNFAEIERKCEIANSSIRKWDKQSPSVKNLKKVAEYLNVSIDYLVYGIEKDELSNDDKKVFEKYMLLSERKKGAVEDKINELLKEQEDEQRVLEQGAG